VREGSTECHPIDGHKNEETEDHIEKWPPACLSATWFAPAPKHRAYFRSEGANHHKATKYKVCLARPDVPEMAMPVVNFRSWSNILQFIDQVQWHSFVVPQFNQWYMGSGNFGHC
jgi:hypothetical protein